MDCVVRWTGQAAGMGFLAETGSGHLVAMDGPPDAGGRNLAPRPMEMLLAGTGGCTAFDVVSILKKSRQKVTGCEVRLSAERAGSEPKVFTRIHLTYRVTGKALKRDAVVRAIELSKEKYCSASIMMAKTADISYELELVEDD